MRISGLQQRLFEPVHIGSLAVFRILFGLLLSVNLMEYLYEDTVHEIFYKQEFHFYFFLPEIFSPLSGHWMYVPFFLALAGSVGIMLGYRFRFSAILFTVAYTYIFLADAHRYNNHYYLICMVGLFLCLSNANGWLSLDVRRNPALKQTAVPRWQLLLFQLQLFVVYFFGGIAKLKPDWLAGSPLDLWLTEFDHHALLGPVMNTTFMAYFLSYSGMLFDLSAGFLLFNRRTRWIGLSLAVFFHLMNEYILLSPELTLSNIGIFPYLGLATLTLFLDPNWPVKVARRLLAKLRGPDLLKRERGVQGRGGKSGEPTSLRAGLESGYGAVGTGVDELEVEGLEQESGVKGKRAGGWLSRGAGRDSERVLEPVQHESGRDSERVWESVQHESGRDSERVREPVGYESGRERTGVWREKSGGLLIGVTGVLVVMILIPVLLYRVNTKRVQWTDQGLAFTWSDRTLHKTGTLSLSFEDGISRDSGHVDISEDLTPRQFGILNNPYALSGYCALLSDSMKTRGYKAPVFKAELEISLNGRPPVRVLDPEVNLAHTRSGKVPDPVWIWPLRVGYLESQEAVVKPEKQEGAE